MHFDDLSQQFTHNLIIDGAEWGSLVDPASLLCKETAQGEVPSLTFRTKNVTDVVTYAIAIAGDTLLSLDDDTTGTYTQDVTLSFPRWAEVIWQITTGGVTTRVFGGYLLKQTWEDAPSGVGRMITCSCQGYAARVVRAEMPAKSYMDWTCGAIAADLFTEAGLTDFDTTTYVSAGLTASSFHVEKSDKLNKVLDRLAALSGFVWKIDAEKNLVFRLATEESAPFGVSDGPSADYATLYPATDVRFSRNDEETINRVIIVGGSRPSDGTTTDTFTGDGATVRFQLEHTKIVAIQVLVDGELYSDGTAWWHTNSERQVVTNYREGWIEFFQAPGIGAVIEAVYTYEVLLVYSQEDTGSINAHNGMVFTRYIQNGAITTEEQAEEVATAILDQFAYGPVNGTFTVRRWGIRAGQTLACLFPNDDIDDDLTVQSVSISPLKSRPACLECSVSVGGRTTRLSDLLPETTGSQAYGHSGWPEIHGTVVSVDLDGIMAALAPGTVFVPA